MCTKVKSPSLNPFPFIFLLILIMTLLIYGSERGYAEERNVFCSEEQIQNFEDMGIDKSSIFYFLSDNQVYNVYSYYDDDVYFNDKDYKFTISDNYMTYGHIGADGKNYVDGYGKEISMYYFKNACILYINENNSIKVENKLDTFITNEGFEIINEYDVCENRPTLFSVPCYLIIMTNNIISFLIQNSFYFILILTSFVISLGIILFIKIREVL